MQSKPCSNVTVTPAQAGTKLSCLRPVPALLFFYLCSRHIMTMLSVVAPSGHKDDSDLSTPCIFPAPRKSVHTAEIWKIFIQ